MTQRQLSLAINLGGEQIALDRVEAAEALSRPFVLNIDLYSTLGEIDLYPHLGKPVVITAREDDVVMRYFHGLLVEGEYLSERSEGFHYRLTARPWTYLLSQNRNFAIYQEMTTIDIVKKVLQPFSYADIDYSKLKSVPRNREYCVQYGESDFGFIARLLEEDGYYYYFRHSASAHTLVLCDSPQAHDAGAFPLLTFNPNARAVANSGSAVRSLVAADHYLERWSERVVTGGEKVASVRDWDFQSPNRPLEYESSATRAHPLDDLEVYAWPAGVDKREDCKRVGDVLLQARRAQRQTYSGETQLSALRCGTKVKVAAHPTNRFNRGYIVTRTHHLLSAEQHRSGGGAGMQSVHFEAVPDDVTWRAPQVSPRPVVRGPETAIVTGPKNEEIYTDHFGRVKVRFHWDRGTSKDEQSTCWIRVSQTGGLGNLILPRVGHEVIVDFLDGDPDRPIVVGRVFNKTHMPVYALPDNKTRALWRTKTYGNTGSVGEAEALDTKSPEANELRFEDKGGKEEVFLHAQRDMTVRVRHSETHHVGLHQENKIGGNQQNTIRKDQKNTIGKNQETAVTGYRKTKVDQTDKLDVAQSIAIKAGTSISIEANTEIKLKVGQSSITITPVGIKITTTQLSIEAKAMAELKAPMTTVKGDGLLTLKGGITMIN